MDKKKYIIPYMEVVNIQAYGMLAFSSRDTIDMKWSGQGESESDPDDIDDYSTFDSF